MVTKAKLSEEYELSYSAQKVFDCLKESVPKTKIVRANPKIKEIDEANMKIDCITPAYKTQITVVSLSSNKSCVKLFIKHQSPCQVIDWWNRNKNNVKSIMDQVLKDLEN